MSGGSGRPIHLEPTHERNRNSYLRGKGFGRGYPDFRSGMRVHARVGFSRDTGTYHVTNTQHRCPGFLCQLDSCQRVGGFPALANRDHHVVGVYHGMPVPEFRRVFHLHGYPGKILDHVLAQQPGVPRGPATDNNNPACR